MRFTFSLDILDYCSNNFNSSFVFKVVYYKGIPEEFFEMQLKGCPVLCPLKNFINLVKDEMFISDKEIICDKYPVPFWRIYYP